MISRIALVVLVVAVAVAGCDTVVPDAAPPSQDPVPGGLLPPLALLDIPVLGAPAGDFLYDLGPLPDGGVFRARLAFDDGSAAELRSTGTPDGAALALAVEGLAPDSVTVSYLDDGVPVAAPVVHRAASGARRTGGAPTYGAGTADSDPDSYHYEWHDGEVIIVKDYKEARSATARAAGGTAFTTLRGERVRVTEVAFTLHGAEPGAPETVRFAAPAPFDLLWFNLAD